jgi:hypothetical protein
MSASPARLGLAVTALLLAGASARAQESLEYTVKAVYLTKFAPFVQWPVEPVIGSPLALCVAGSDPFGTVLDKAIMGQVGRPIVVKRLAVLTPDSGCHVAFVGSGAAAAQSLAAVRGQPVLTVSENAADDSARGIVNFIVRAGRVRFEIDKPTAERSRLVISSKLLNLAVPRPR